MKSGNSHWLLRLVFAIQTVVMVLSTCWPTHAQPADEIYNQAGELYRQQQFAEAAEKYNKLLNQGYDAPEVYFNLGNCYFKLDSMGQSVLNFERALKLEPGDEDATHNLKLANLRLIDRIEAVPELAIITWWKQFVQSSSSSRWAVLSLITLGIAFALAATALFVGRRKILFGSAFIFLAASAMLLYLAAIQQSAEQNKDWGILLASSSQVRSAPDAKAGNLFMLHEGTKVKVLDRVENWSKIRLADGKVGWVESASLELI